MGTPFVTIYTIMLYHRKCIVFISRTILPMKKRRDVFFCCSAANQLQYSVFHVLIRYLPHTIELDIFFFITRSSEIVSQCHWPLIIIITIINNIFFLVNDDCCRVSEEMAIKTAITLAITTLREILLLVPFFGNVQ